MIGGGKWKTQNKILNGTYMNFISKKKANTTIKHSINDNGSGSTPNVPDTPIVVVTSASLGVAVLGKMILGSEG